jgi:methyltransferase, FkbM family
MGIRLINSIQKRLFGEYTQYLLWALYESCVYRDGLVKLKLEIALNKYFRKKRYNEIVYDYLLNNYYKDNVFDFGFVRLPNENTGSFINQISGLILPYISQGTFLKNFESEGTYEQFGVSVENGDTVIDAGANIGIFSAYAASRGANVYAFEPVPETLACLKQTLDINQNKFSIIPLALSDKTGSTEIYIDPKSKGTASIVTDRNYHTVSIQSSTLDEWVETENIKQIDFIKADIEGAERLLLKGARNVLREFKPKLALCTYHFPDDPVIMEKLILDANPSYKITQSPQKLFAC